LVWIWLYLWSALRCLVVIWRNINKTELNWTINLLTKRIKHQKQQITKKHSWKTQTTATLDFSLFPTKFYHTTKQVLVHFDIFGFQSRAKLKDQQQHQPNQEQPTAQIVPHISDTASKWQQDAKTYRCLSAKPKHSYPIEGCSNSIL